MPEIQDVRDGIDGVQVLAVGGAEEPEAVLRVEGLQSLAHAFRFRHRPRKPFDAYMLVEDQMQQRRRIRIRRRGRGGHDVRAHLVAAEIGDDQLGEEDDGEDDGQRGDQMPVEKHRRGNRCDGHADPVEIQVEREIGDENVQQNARHAACRSVGDP